MTDIERIELEDRVEYRLNGKLHREDGPAVEWFNNYKIWYKNGKRHREDGPAVEYLDGTKSWWKNGKHHRLDGPAIYFASGYKQWWVEGEELTEEEFNKHPLVKAYQEERKIKIMENRIRFGIVHKDDYNDYVFINDNQGRYFYDDVKEAKKNLELLRPTMEKNFGWHDFEVISIECYHHGDSMYTIFSKEYVERNRK
jgi:hypothetical protein